MLHRFNEGLNFISLLLGDISKAYQIDCNIVFFEFLSQNFQCLRILQDTRTYEAYHSLFLGFVWPMLKSQSTNLEGLNLS